MTPRRGSRMPDHLEVGEIRRTGRGDR
jgi:hypothetical protein